MPTAGVDSVHAKCVNRFAECVRNSRKMVIIWLWLMIRETRRNEFVPFSTLHSTHRTADATSAAKFEKMFSPCSSSTYQSNARAYLLLSRFAEILTCWKRQIKIGKNDRDRHRPGQSVDIIVTNVQSKCLMWNAWLINCMRALPERLYPIFSGLRALFLTRNARRKFITEFNPIS